MDFEKLKIKPFEPEDLFVVQGFFCGNNMLNNYIKDSYCALADQRNGITSTTLILYDDDVVGYYACNSNILTVDVNEARGIGLQESFSVPAFEIKNYAISQRYQGKGVGLHIFKRLLGQIASLTDTMAARYIFLWSVEEAIGFYENKLLFERMDESSDYGLTLMRLPLVDTFIEYEEDVE
jgi:GNAT superfamily N-acetyltransferase